MTFFVEYFPTQMNNIQNTLETLKKISKNEIADLNDSFTRYHLYALFEFLKETENDRTQKKTSSTETNNSSNMSYNIIHLPDDEIRRDKRIWKSLLSIENQNVNAIKAHKILERICNDIEMAEEREIFKNKFLERLENLKKKYSYEEELF